MLDPRGDDVSPPVLLGLRQGAAPDGQVVALAAAAREDDLVGPTVQDLGNTISRIVERASRPTADAVHARRVAPIR
jgi:hypothetical protein